MKKLFLLLLSMFAVVGIISCTGDETITVPTDETLTVSEQLDMPVNLSINETSKTLSWDAVEDAVRYNVYVDGELEAEVNGTSYDFSSLTGEKLVFTVKAMAPTGLQNSNHSATHAYIANKASAKLALTASLATNGLTVNNPDAFAEELLNKGMLASDLDSMMTNAQNAVGSIDGSMLTLQSVYTLIDNWMDTMDLVEIEALISALIKVELPTTIQEELDLLIEEDGTCSYYSSYNDECYYYYDYSEDILMLQTMLEFINNHGDEAVRSAMIVVEYVMDVEASIDSEMISNIESIMDVSSIDGSMDDIDFSMLVTVKNDMINMFKDNLPELEDVILLNTTVLAFVEILAEDSMDTSVISVAKQSASSLASIELFFNFLLEMNQEYMTSIVGLLMPNVTEETGKEFIKQNIALIDSFLTNNQTEIEALNNLYTDEEQETLFYELMIMSMTSSFYAMDLDMELDEFESQIRTIIEENFDFNNILILQEAMGENFNALLDSIIASDYAIVDIMFDLAAISEGSEFGDFIAYSDNEFDSNFFIDVYLGPGTYYLIVEGYDNNQSGELDVSIFGDNNPLLNTSEYLNVGGSFAYEFTITTTTHIEAYSEGYLDTVGWIVSEETYLGTTTEGPTQQELTFDLVKEMLRLMNPMIQDMTIEEYDAFINMFLSIMTTQGLIVDMAYGEEMDMGMNAFTVLFGMLNSAIEDTTVNQLNIIKNLFATLSTPEYMDELEGLIVEMETNENASFGIIILMANVYLDFYLESTTDIDVLVDQFITTMSTPDMLNQLDITQAEVDEIETMIETFLTTMSTQVTLIKDYDYTNLNEVQMNNIMSFMMMFGSMYYADMN